MPISDADYLNKQSNETLKASFEVRSLTNSRSPVRQWNTGAILVEDAGSSLEEDKQQKEASMTKISDPITFGNKTSFDKSQEEVEGGSHNSAVTKEGSIITAHDKTGLTSLLFNPSDIASARVPALGSNDVGNGLLAEDDVRGDAESKENVRLVKAINSCCRAAESRTF